MNGFSMPYEQNRANYEQITLDKNGALQIRAKTNSSQTPVDFHQNQLKIAKRLIQCYIYWLWFMRFAINKLIKVECLQLGFGRPTSADASHESNLGICPATGPPALRTHFSQEFAGHSSFLEILWSIILCPIEFKIC